MSMILRPDKCQLFNIFYEQHHGSAVCLIKIKLQCNHKSEYYIHVRKEFWLTSLFLLNHIKIL